MKRTKKILVTLLCAVLLVTGTVAVTVAYLTSTTEVATNTFTVGDVKIILNETDVDKDELEDVNYLHDSVARDTKNAYHIFPNGTYDKDPMVSVKADSEDCYIRMIVTVSDIEALEAAMPDFVATDGTFLLQNVVNWDSQAWPFYEYREISEKVDDTTTITKGVYEFRYEKMYSVPENATTVDVTSDTTEENGKYVQLEPLFTKITLPADINNEELAHLDNVTIDIVAHAMQADGFVDTTNDAGEVTTAEQNAWDAFPATQVSN